MTVLAEHEPAITALDHARLMRGQRVVLELDVTVLEVWPGALVVETVDGARLRVPRGKGLIVRGAQQPAGQRSPDQEEGAAMRGD